MVKFKELTNAQKWAFGLFMPGMHGGSDCIPGARPEHYAEMIHALRGSGFDVARGVVLDGIPVKPYAA